MLVALLVLLQYPLWFGKGGLLRVRDQKSGYEAIEERARYELGLVKESEVFVQTPQKRP